MILFFEIFFGFYIIALFIGLLISGPRYKGPVSDHFNGRTFINPGGIKAKGLRDVFRWMFQRRRGPWPVGKDFVIGPKPVERIVNGVRITFVNHSTFLIQTDGINILTDPVWSQRTSPFEWAGPKRKRPPGIKFDDLPPIDLILLSHNHWDHLDISTLGKINRRDHPMVVTSLGITKFLNSNGLEKVKDLDWWEETDFNPAMTIQSVPAQHFSGRGMFDRDGTLWAGFVIKRAGGNIYFAGDTGYNSNTFKEIGKKCGPIAVALIPIGAYDPRWFMSPIHCSPEEAVMIHSEINPKVSVATHFGTFQLADDGKDEPARALKQALHSANVSEDSFVILKEGVAHDF